MLEWIAKCKRRGTSWLIQRPRTTWVARQLVHWAFFLSLPFLMISWAIPFLSKRTFGNDYGLWSIAPQLEIVWSARGGTFPVYMPGFTVGHSAAAMTLAQVFHPITWLSAVMPGYGDGRALEWNTLYRFLSLGVAHAALYGLCRRLSVTRLVALAATFPAVYNLRMLDSFRYGASLEGYTGMLFLCAACGFAYLERGTLRSTAWVALSTYLLVVSGNPQWAYLGALAAFFFAGTFPWIAPALSKHESGPGLGTLAPYARSLLVGGVSGVFLSLPYILPFYFEVLKTNHARAESKYSWTLDYADSLSGELCNFLQPFHAEVHGGFAGSGLFLMVALLPLALLARQRVPKVFWVLYGLLFVAFMFSVGIQGIGNGAVHWYMVRFFPGFNVFRVPGRILLWVPALAWPIWVWMLLPANRGALLWLAGGALTVFLSKWFWGTDGYPPYEYSTPRSIVNGHMSRFIDTLPLYLAGATFGLLSIGAKRARWAPYALVLALAPVGLSTWECLRHGTWTEKKPTIATFSKMTELRKVSPTAQDVAGNGMELRAVSEYRERKVSTNRPIGTVTHDVETAPTLDAILKRLVVPPAPPLFIDPPPVALGGEVVAPYDEVKLVYNTANRFDFDVIAAKDGYFTLGLPWMKGFEARVDGAEAPVAVANGLFPSVMLPRGRHRVAFRFVSKPFAVGLAIAYLTMVAWLGAALRPRLRPLGRRLTFALVAAFVGLVLVVGWQRWLYGGSSYHTEFYWRGPPAAATQQRT